MASSKKTDESSTAVMEPETMSDITAVSMQELEQDRKRWVALVKESAENNKPAPHPSILMRYGLAQGITADLETCRQEFADDVKALRDLNAAEKNLKERKRTRERQIKEHGSQEDLKEQLLRLNDSVLEVKSLLHQQEQNDFKVGTAMARLNKATIAAARILEK